MTNSNITQRVAARFRQGAVKRLDMSWLEGLRKDFLTLLKNLPKAKDYDTAQTLREAFIVYREGFHELFFEHFLNHDLKYYHKEIWNPEGWDKELRAPAWMFYIEMSLPINMANERTGTLERSKEAEFYHFEQKYPAWKAKIQRRAQDFWKVMKRFLSSYEQQTGGQGGPDVRTPDVDRTEIEGLKVIMRGFQSEDEYHREELSVIREGLHHYKQRAAAVAPILLQKQVPITVQFKVNLDKGGDYDNGMINFYASSCATKGPHWVAHALAHEMGHHLWRTYISDDAQEYWRATIHGDLGDLNLKELLAKWPGDTWAFDFTRVMGDVDPILALQVEAISNDTSLSNSREGLQKKEDFQKLLDEGHTTIRVPKTPITGYANKNPEEAFCETMGLLISYGPRAVDPKVQQWLETAMPGVVKLATYLR